MVGRRKAGRHGFGPRTGRRELPRERSGLRQGLPDIKLKVTAELIRDTLPRIQRERAANIYSADVIVGAATPVYTAGIPNGVLDDLKSVLIRPDVASSTRMAAQP
jgi:hypothetical protein